MCYLLIGCYTAYSVSTIIVDACAVLPPSANWDKTVKPERKIDSQKLYFANTDEYRISRRAVTSIAASFLMEYADMEARLQYCYRCDSIGLAADDCVNLAHDIPAQARLECIFCLGVLTLLASIFRLTEYFKLNSYDTSCKSCIFITVVHKAT